MLFNSEVFLFAFLPLTLAAYYILGTLHRTRLAILALVLASLFYYGWWNPSYLPLIIGSMVGNYLLGFALTTAVQSGRKQQARWLLALGVAGNLGALGYFKYAGFFVGNLVAAGFIGTDVPQILLPLAISFFTFQQIAYLADVYQDKVAENDPLSYALFVTFFPQLIAGPIVHHSEMMPQFRRSGVGRLSATDMCVGSAIFFVGLFKKVVIADNIAPFADSVFNAAEAGVAISFADAWAGSLAYTFQIYFDFSGYSDMALGIGRLFGIHLPLNFNSPYKATGIVDFWRRWHMTLSRFLRDYLYIPLGGNRLGPGRRYINMMIVMLLGGLWHGAGWTFVAWGALHGACLGINHAWRAWRGEPSRSVIAIGASRVLTFLVVVVAWVFFRAESFAAANMVLQAMVDTPGLSPHAVLASLTMDPTVGAWILVLAAVTVALPNTQQLFRAHLPRDFYRIGETSGLFRAMHWTLRPASALFIAVVTALAIMSLWQPSVFLYYQF